MAVGKRRRVPPLWVWVAVVLLLGAGGVGALVWLNPISNPTSGVGPTDLVTRGPLVVRITESGEVEADKRKVISNELRWPVIIKEVVEEGARVQEGDVIIHFECKELADAIAQQKITVTTARNSYTAAHENMELKRKELANKLQKARQAVEDAQEDKKRYVEGEWPVKKSDAQSAIMLAERDLALAKDKLDFKVKANKDPDLNKPYSDSEIQADQLGVQRLELALQKAVNNRDMLLKYDHKRQLRTLETGVTDAGLDLERTTLEQKTQLLVSEAEEEAKKATLKMQEDKLKDLLEDEGKLIVKAEKEGLVVYDTGSRRWTSQTVTVGVGERISSRQQLMIIPDMTTLQVETKVYEAMIDQVRADLPAFIRMEGRPDEVLLGKVARVGVLPSSQHRWMNPETKVFKVIVRFDPGVSTEGLKPNMTAEVELILARLKNVLSVPVATVFTEQDKTYCWRVTDEGKEKVAVEVGLMSDTRIQILKGLDEGDRVLLAPTSEEKPREDAAADEAKAADEPEVKPKPEPKPGPLEAPGPQPDRPEGPPGGRKTRPGTPPKGKPARPGGGRRGTPR